MSTQAPGRAPPFPPGMSHLERLPDEIKLRVGCFLMRPPEAKVTRKRGTVMDDLRDEFLSMMESEWKEYRSYDDSVLALSATSTRLCNVFLNEHSRKYGPQNTLCRSIELGDVNLVQRIVDYGADINKANMTLDGVPTPLQLAFRSGQLPVILYLLRRGVAKADELVMDMLRGRVYLRRNIDMSYEPLSLKNRCHCHILHDLVVATLGSSQGSHTGPRLPRETRQALIPTGRHLWFILHTCMRSNWACDCGGNKREECPIRLISLLRRYGAQWMPCGPLNDMAEMSEQGIVMFDFFETLIEDDWTGHCDVYYHGSVRGLADLRRFEAPLSLVDNSIFCKPSVAGAMHSNLLANTAYRRDHCIPFLVAMLEHGINAKHGDLSSAMDLASQPATHLLSIAIVVALLQAGTDANEPGAMMTAMRLACMEATKDAAVAFVILLLEHGADPSSEEMQDQIQSTAEQWWIQSTWQSSGVFHRILLLLARNGLKDHIAWEISAVLGLYHDPAEKGGDSIKP